jgi:ribosomal protein S18 acetylase RimI-like enzyme
MTTAKAAMVSADNVRVRRLRASELWTVLALERRIMPSDPWTADSAGGWLARLTGDGQARFAAGLARFFRLVRLNEAFRLGRLSCWVAFGRPADLCCFVAAAGKDVIGYAVLSSASGDTGGIHTIMVEHGHEGQKIGKALLTQLITTAESHGYQAVTLYVGADNTHARTFYERNDFTVTGTLAGYYQPSATDAIVMRRNLPGGRSDALSHR